MTSPITHEKIIEVLREADEAFTSGDLSGHDVIMTEEYRRGIVIVRDLYQRLQAEKEGGWQPIETAPRDELTVVLVPGGIAHWSVSDQAWMSLTAQTWPGLPIQWEVRHWMPMPPIPPEYRPAPPLNQEGGDAAGTAGRDSSSEVGKHVAPPASANAGTGRATWTAEELLGPYKVDVFAGAFGPSWRGMLADVDAALASERQRGLAEGERIGIEKAAKVADDHPLSPSPVKTAERIVSAIRALTGDPQT